MKPLKISLLGAPRVERDGEPVEVDTRKAVALLSYLALPEHGKEAQVHTRDALALLLWPELDQSRARAALRRTLSPLRKALDKDFLEVTRESIGLRPDVEVWIDVLAFRERLAQTTGHGHPPGDVCPVCLAPLRQAVALYRGDFMAGFTLRDSPEFDEWQYYQGDAVRRDLDGALERLVRGLTLQGQFGEAIEYAQRRLALDPLREEAHVQLMQLFSWAGERENALRQYRDCVRALDEELGVAPLEETTALYQRIREGRLQPPVVVADPAAPAEATETTGAPLALPLVSREKEWMVLLQAYQEADERGQFVALEGEAGIGKTRLAEELVAHARRRAATVMSARCYQGESDLAYGPFVEALREGTSDEGMERLLQLSPHRLSELNRLLPEIGALAPDLPEPPPLAGPGAQSRFFAAVGEALHRLAGATAGGQPPGILFLDDLHWADAASLDLLAYLVRRLNHYPLLILATWRNELSRSHQLNLMAAEAARIGDGRLLSLQRLRESAVTTLVQAAGVEERTKGLQSSLFLETEGLPLFIVAYLEAYRTASTESTGSDWMMPSSVRDLLRSRLLGLEEIDIQLLQTAAVIGRRFDFDVLRVASGRSEGEAVGALEDLLKRGLIGEGEGGGQPLYDFSHDKLRAVVYDETSLARRRLLHRRVAEVLEQQTRTRERPALAGQIAHHYRQAGDEARAADYFVEAGDYARALYANREALAHYQTALALSHPNPAALHEAIGDLHTLLGDYAASIGSYETAAALAAGDEASTARLEYLLGSVYHRQGEWGQAESHFEAARASLGEEGSEAERSRLYAAWSRTAHHAGAREQAKTLAQQALALAQAAGDGRALAQAHNVAGILARREGDAEGALYHLKQSLGAAEALADLEAEVAALNNLALVHAEAAAPEAARPLLEQALSLCATLGDRHREAAIHNNLADLLHRSGAAEEAMDHLKWAVTIYAEIGQDTDGWQPEIWKLVEW